MEVALGSFSAKGAMFISAWGNAPRGCIGSFSANGARFISAWGNAPGILVIQKIYER
jgi:hypothetical protein